QIQNESKPPASAGGLNSQNESHSIHGNSDSFVAKEKELTTNTHEQTQTNPNTTTPYSAFRTPHLRRRLNTVAEWETGLGGGVRAVGVGGGITGFGANLVIIDDPVRSRAEAESKTYREKIYDWFNDDLYTRLEPNASIILIQTRWHEDDLAGRLLKEAEDGGEHWDVISLPALSEPPASAGGQNVGGTVPSVALDRRKITGGEIDSTISNLSANGGPISISTNWPPADAGASDPLGRFPGEALCADRFNEEDL